MNKQQLSEAIDDFADAKTTQNVRLIAMMGQRLREMIQSLPDEWGVEPKQEGPAPTGEKP